MKIPFVLGLAICLWGGWTSLFGKEEGAFSEKATLDDLLLYAVEHSPMLRASFEEWRAATERGPQARSLPDPQISYGYYLERMETRQSISLSQAFPWFGVRGLRAGVAEERAEAANERFEAERRRLFSTVKTAYAEYVYAVDAARIVEHNRDLVERLAGVVEGLLRAGRVGASDLLRIQSEIDRVEEEFLRAETYRRPAAAQLNRALGRPAGAQLPEPGTIETEPFLRDRREELLTALRFHPELRAGDSEVAASEREVRLARREGYPEFGAGIEWMDNPGLRDEVRGMVTVSLPVWRQRYAAGVREARAGRERAFHQREAIEQKLEARLATAIFSLENAERRVTLYRESLIPRARQTIEAVEGAYRAGRSGFLDLVGSQRMLLDLELAEARAVADRFQRLAELEELAGPAALFSIREEPEEFNE